MSIWEWKIKASVDMWSVKQATRQLKGELKRTGDDIENNVEKRWKKAVGWLSDAFWSLKRLIAWVFVTVWITKFFTWVAKLWSELEQASISFETLLWSTEKAGEHLEKIDQFASRTPFNKLWLIKTNQQLLWFGFQAEQSLATMQVLGDSISAVWRGDADLQGVVLALWQIQAKGKLSTEEVLQMAERWLPIFQVLEQQLWLTKEQMGDLGNQWIDSATAINAILTWLNEKFAWSMEKQSKTLWWMWSNLVDNTQIAMWKMWLQIGKNLKGIIGWFNDFIDNNMWSIIDFGADVLNFILDTWKSLFQVLWLLVTTISDMLGWLLGENARTAEWSMKTWKKFFLFMSLWIQTILLLLNTFIWTIGGVIKSVASGVWSFVGWIGLYFQDFWKNLANGVIKKANLMISWINLLLKAVWEEWIKTIKTFDTALEKSWWLWWKTWKDVADTWSSSFWKMWDANKKIMWNMINSVNEYEIESTKAWNKNIDVFKDNADYLDSISWKYGKMWKDATKGWKEAWKSVDTVKDKIKDLEKEYKDVEKQIDNNIKAQKKYAEDSEKYNEKIIDDIRKTNKVLDERKAKLEEEIGILQSEETNDLAERYVEIKERQKEILEETNDLEQEWFGDEDKRLENLKKVNEQIEIQNKKISEITDKTKESTKLSLKNKLEDLKVTKEKLETTNQDIDEIEKILELEKERKKLAEETWFIEWKVAKDKLDDAQRFAGLTDAEKIAEESTKKQALLQKEFDEEKARLEQSIKINQAFLQIKELDEEKLSTFLETEAFKRFTKEEQALLLKLAREKIALTQQKDAIILQQQEISDKTIELSITTTEVQMANINDLQSEYTSLIAQIDRAIAKQRSLNALRGSTTTWFATWWFTGAGWTNEVKGVVHGGEWVAPKWMVNDMKPLFDNLEWARTGSWWNTITNTKTQTNHINVNGWNFDAQQFLDYAKWKL